MVKYKVGDKVIRLNNPGNFTGVVWEIICFKYNYVILRKIEKEKNSKLRLKCSVAVDMLEKCWEKVE